MVVGEFGFLIVREFFIYCLDSGVGIGSFDISRRRMVWGSRRGGGDGGCVCVSDWSGSIGSGLCAFWWYMSGLMASEAEPLFHVSVSFIKRHSVCGLNVFHWIWVMVGRWSVLRFISWESEFLLLCICVSSEMCGDSFKLSPLIVEVWGGGIPAFQGGWWVFLLENLVL